ncbi:MAG: hypothetical protein IJV03_04045 [Alphaproteobacteria bacterium]|nr:hypothetical protein [Alphaproteobacteria bacterium]
MQQQAHIVAQRLLNLYRQAHVIVGGWAAVNRVLVSESNDAQVIKELLNLPTGQKLVEHINNLKSGKTPMNTIDNDLLPYGGTMSGQEINVSISKEEIEQLKQMLEHFEPTLDGLNEIKNLPFVKNFGNDWIEDIKSSLAGDNTALAQWDNVVRTNRAYQMWDEAQQLVSETLTERNRAQIQADMPEFETYLPMFGDAGNELLSKLRTFMSSMA